MAQLSAVSTVDGLLWMVKENYHYTAGTVLPFMALLTERSIGFETSCDLVRLNVCYTDILNSMLADQDEVPSEERELSRLRSGIGVFNHAVQRLSASRCTSEMYTLKLHTLDHPLENLEEFESTSFTNAASFEHLTCFLSSHTERCLDGCQRDFKRLCTYWKTGCTELEKLEMR